MSRDQQDLQDLIAVLERRADRAPDEHAVRAALRTRSARRRRRPAVRSHRLLVVVGAAAAVVAVTATAAGLTHDRATGPATPPATGPMSPNTVSPNTTRVTDAALYTYDFHARAVAGFAVQTRRLEPGRQTIVYSADRKPGAIAGIPDAIDVVLHTDGSFDPTSVRSGTAVSVNGTPGFFGPALGRTRTVGVDSIRRVPSVAWQYAPDRWAVVTGVLPAFRAQAIELAIARSVDLSARDTARLPFRIGYLPAGLQATMMSGDEDTITPTPSGAWGTATFGRGARPDVVRIEVSRVVHQSVTALFGPGGAPLTVGGFPAKIDTSVDDDPENRTLTVITPTFVCSIGVDPSVTTAELTLIGQRMTYTTAPDDPGSWFAVHDALPH